MPLLQKLNTLESTGLIRLAVVQPELEYLFRHALVQDAAYGSLLKKDRRQLHRRVGESLEQIYPERLEEIASTLAYHFAKADERSKAIHYFTLAGDRASASYANNEAIQFYQSALAQIAIETDQDRSTQQCQLHEYLGELLNLIGQREAARENFATAIDLVNRATPGNAIWQARLHRKTALSFVEQRTFSEAEQHFVAGENKLLRVSSDEAEWWQERIQNQVDRLWMHYTRNQPETVENISQQIKPWLDAHGNAIQRARFYYSLTLLDLRRNRYAVTAEMLNNQLAGTKIADETDNPHLIAEMHFVTGFLWLWRGNLGEAQKELDTAINLAERTGNVMMLARSLTYLVVLHRLRKDVAKLQELLPRLEQVLAAARLPEYLPYIPAINAWLAFQAGQLNEAYELAQEAVDLLHKAPAHLPFYWLARWPILSVAFQRGDLAEAIEQAREMLLPAQQKLPDDVTAALEAAVKADEQGALDAARPSLALALQLATEKGYL